MKLFYCPESNTYGQFLVVMAEDIDDCEKKVRSFLDIETRRQSVPPRLIDNSTFMNNFVRKVIESILANKKNWQEIESGIFNGAWE